MILIVDGAAYKITIEYKYECGMWDIDAKQKGGYTTAGVMANTIEEGMRAIHFRLTKLHEEARAKQLAINKKAPFNKRRAYLTKCYICGRSSRYGSFNSADNFKCKKCMIEKGIE